MQLRRHDYSQLPYAGIIRCLPAKYLTEITATKNPETGLKVLDRAFVRFLNAQVAVRQGRYWQWSLPSRPRIEVVYLYIVIGSMLRYRANIIGYGGMTRIDAMRSDGRIHPIYAKHVVKVTGPVVKPPHEIRIQGFQGFRYCRELF